MGNPLPLPTGSHPLAYAGQEVRAIATLFTDERGRVLAGQDATRRRVAGSLRGTTHFHLACHGSFNVTEPLDSALHLAGMDRLTLRDLLDGDLDLSGSAWRCSRRARPGSATCCVPLTRPSGCPPGSFGPRPGVVATLWPVNDVSTALLMAEFYRLLITERLDPARALHRAQAHLRDSTPAQLDLAGWFERRYEDSGGTDTDAFDAASYFRARPDADPPFADPYYWAGFTYTGA